MCRVAANYIATRLNEKGKVVEITGQPGTSTANDRSEGFNMVNRCEADCQLQAWASHVRHGEYPAEQSQDRYRFCCKR